MQSGLDNSRKIENNIEFIKNLFLNIVKMPLDTDLNFKQGVDDLDVYFTLRGDSYKLVYNQFKDSYFLSHFNRGSNKKEAIHFHTQFESLSLPNMVKFISTVHNTEKYKPTKKQSRMEKLFEQINEIKSK